MNLVMLVDNVLETGTLTATSEATPKARLHDRAPDEPWVATSNAQQDLTTDQGGSPRPFSHVALVGYVVDTSIEIASGAASPSSLRATIAPAGGDPRLIDLGGEWSDQHVRARILSGGSVPELGELVIGKPYIIGVSGRPETRPALTTSPLRRGVVGSVVRERAVGGRLITTKLAPPVTRIRYTWPALPEPELDILFAAFAGCDEGSKPFVVQDVFGAVRWMAWMDEQLEPILAGVNSGVRVYEIGITLETAA